MLAHKETVIHTSTRLQPKKVWKKSFAKDLCSIKRIFFEKFSQHINVFYRNIEFTMEEESNGKSAFPDTLSELKNGNIFLLTSRKPVQTDQYSNFNSNHQTFCK